MAIITDVRFAHEDGALTETLRSLPALTVSIVRETSTAPGRRVFVYRFDGVDPDRIRRALDDDPTVREATPVSATDDRQLWKLEFTPETELLGPRLSSAGGFVIDAHSTSTRERGQPATGSTGRSAQPQHVRSADSLCGWRERWLVPDPGRLSTIWQHARSAGFEFEVLDLSRQLRPAGTLVGADPLTEQQRTALVTAYEQGYFREPRETSLDALAETLGVSPSAVNGRLRRGLRALVEETLVIEPADDRHSDGAIDAGWPPISAMISTRLYVAHSALALSATIRSVTDAEITVLSDVRTDPHQDAYFFLIEAPAFDAVESALDDDHTVADATAVLAFPGRRTYRIEYTDEAKLLTPAVVDRGGLTLESRSYRDGWQLHLQLPGHDALDELREYARTEGIRFDVLELTQNDTIGDREGVELTPAQTETLRAAYSHGYYDEPRETSTVELAELLGLSTTAVSGRLRRGSERLIEEVLVDDRE